MNDFLRLFIGQKENFDGVAVGGNFTDKRFFTDKPLIKTVKEFRCKKFYN